ncbi:hypothetical protein AB0F71_14275 [Kitasatospora sp. NPDC028055]|uniref:hypothetical protein n=1 Tax=Kitasatospora sp. NPDC028055 TaxID=3155653 RepID=UPI0033F70FDD
MYLRFREIAETLRGRGRSVPVGSHLAHDTERLDAVHQLAGIPRGGVKAPASA